MVTMRTNVLRNNISDDKAQDFNAAVKFELKAMTMQKIDNDIEAIQRKLESKRASLTKVERDGLHATIDSLKADRDKVEASMENLKERHFKVVTAMTIKNAEGQGNDALRVRNVLRVLATTTKDTDYARGSQLVKYALLSDVNVDKLYAAMQQIHVLRNGDTINDDGSITTGGATQKAYKEAKSIIESTMKQLFSLPYETEYTEKFRVRMNAKDFALLHDSYVTGFNNQFSDSKKDNNEERYFKDITVNTMIKEKKNRKTGTVTYNYSRLSQVLCKLVVGKLAMAKPATAKNTNTVTETVSTQEPLVDNKKEVKTATTEDYSNMTVKELRHELSNLGVKVNKSAKKAELVSIYSQLANEAMREAM